MMPAANAIRAAAAPRLRAGRIFISLVGPSRRATHGHCPANLRTSSSRSALADDLGLRTHEDDRSGCRSHPSQHRGHSRAAGSQTAAGFHTVTLVDPDLVALGVPPDSPLGQGGRADDAVVPDGHHVREHSVAIDEQAVSAGAVLVTQLGAWVAVIAACVGQGVHPDRRTAVTLPRLTPAVVAAPGPVRSSLLPAGGLPG